MNTIAWNNDFTSGYIIKNGRHTRLINKPEMSFEYQSLLFLSTGGSIKEVPERIALTEEEVLECENWLESYDVDVLDTPRNVYGVGEDREFLGVGRIGEFSRHVTSAPPPGHHYYDFGESRWKFVYGVDANGRYIGNVEPKEATYFADSEPVDANRNYWDEASSSWVERRDIAFERGEAISKLRKQVNSVRVGESLLFQEEIEKMRVEEAERVLARQGEVDSESIPLLTTELELDENLVLLDIARRIVDAYDEKKRVLKGSEILRIKFESRINNSQTVEEVDTSFEEFESELAFLQALPISQEE